MLAFGTTIQLFPEGKTKALAGYTADSQCTEAPTLPPGWFSSIETQAQAV